MNKTLIVATASLGAAVATAGIVFGPTMVTAFKLQNALRRPGDQQFASLHAVKDFVMRQVDKVLIPQDEYTSFEALSAQHRHAKAESDEMIEVGKLLTSGQEGSMLDSPILRDTVNGIRRPPSREQHRN